MPGEETGWFNLDTVLKIGGGIFFVSLLAYAVKSIFRYLFRDEKE